MTLGLGSRILESLLSVFPSLVRNPRRFPLPPDLNSGASWDLCTGLLLFANQVPLSLCPLLQLLLWRRDLLSSNLLLLSLYLFPWQLSFLAT